MWFRGGRVAGCLCVSWSCGGRVVGCLCVSWCSGHVECGCGDRVVGCPCGGWSHEHRPLSRPCSWTGRWPPGLDGKCPLASPCIPGPHVLCVLMVLPRHALCLVLVVTHQSSGVGAAASFLSTSGCRLRAMSCPFLHFPPVRPCCRLLPPSLGPVPKGESPALQVSRCQQPFQEVLEEPHLGSFPR